MLKIGQRAPDFTLPDDDGGEFHLADALEKGPVILYFYPADFTSVCSREATMFREEHHRLAERGLRVYGISPQTSECHGRFKKHLKLPFHLLADVDKKVMRDYDALGLFGFVVRRVTYFVGRNGLIQDRALADFKVSCHRELLDRILQTMP